MSALQSMFLIGAHHILGAISALIFIWVIVSLLVGFNVISMRNPTVSQIYYTLQRFIEPLLQPIRRVLPPMNGIDFSPLVAIILIQWMQIYLVPTIGSIL